MRVLLINSVCGIKSTGRIATEIAQSYITNNHEVVIAYGRDTAPSEFEDISKKITTDFEIIINGIKARLFDNEGLNAVTSTKRFLKWADKYNPDLLWLHNLHGYYLNYALLFEWIKSRPNMEVKWTLHDCWAFTGHCTYFTFANCNKWQSKCINCPQKYSYPKSCFVDRSFNNHEKKRQLFTGVKQMTIVTPSNWLAELVSNSFLNEYPVVVRHNSISTEFHPVNSTIKESLGIEDNFLILGVAAQWTERKGLNDFIDLSSRLGNDYSIVLVGLTDKQLRDLPDNIIGLKSTNSVSDLIKLYSAADVFFNPTYEDNYPTTNLEAQACGTPVLTYNTGGSPESVPKENVFSKGDLDSVAKAIINREYIDEVIIDWID